MSRSLTGAAGCAYLLAVSSSCESTLACWGADVRPMFQARVMASMTVAINRAAARVVKSSQTLRSQYRHFVIYGIGKKIRRCGPESDE